MLYLFTLFKVNRVFIRLFQMFFILFYIESLLQFLQVEFVEGILTISFTEEEVNV